MLSRMDDDAGSTRFFRARSVDVTRHGIGFGCSLAIVISYVHNHSIIWAIIDGLLSWFYVIFSALTY